MAKFTIIEKFEVRDSNYLPIKIFHNRSDAENFVLILTEVAEKAFKSGVEKAEADARMEKYRAEQEAKS